MDKPAVIIPNKGGQRRHALETYEVTATGLGPIWDALGSGTSKCGKQYTGAISTTGARKVNCKYCLRTMRKSDLTNGQ